ncbi:methyltransferase domain-containing protein [Chloroflexota bacterium]
MDNRNLKEQVRDYWNKESCGAGIAASTKFSRQYFEEIEQNRYIMEPEIFSFAQFTRFRGKKILEIGIGAGTDFIQWVRAGAKAYGIDLTEEAVEHAKKRLDIYGLKAEDLRVADAENLPYSDNTFDLVYSWGVIHHTPDTIRALEEILRVARIGGAIKLMVYNRWSLTTLYMYLYFGLLRGRPFRSIAWILYHHQESIGTRAFTIREVRNMLSKYPVHVRDIRARVTKYDLLWDKPPLLRLGAYLLACLFGFDRVGWFITIELEKTNAVDDR